MGYFNDVKESLETGVVEFVLSATIITNERDAYVDFSCPYIVNGWCLTRSTLDDSIVLDTVEKINVPSVKFGVIEGKLHNYLS